MRPGRPLQLVLAASLALFAPRVAAAQAHPLAACTVQRGAIGFSTNVTLFCGPAQVAVRRFPEPIGAETLLAGFEEELRALAGSIGAEVTWIVARIDVGGGTRSVAQYTLKTTEHGVLRTGLVVPGAATTTDVYDCSSADATAALECKALIDTAIRNGLPPGVAWLPFVGDLRKATVLGRDVSVVPGCKAQFLFDDAVHVMCADGEMMFGAHATLSAEGGATDPVDTVHEQLGGGGAGKEGPCTVGGASATCWSTLVNDGGVPIRVVTARPTIGGKKAVLVCSWTVVGDSVHPLCGQVLAF